jgi:hypothetical protein
MLPIKRHISSSFSPFHIGGENNKVAIMTKSVAFIQYLLPNSCSYYAGEGARCPVVISLGWCLHCLPEEARWAGTASGRWMGQVPPGLPRRPGSPRLYLSIYVFTMTLGHNSGEIARKGFTVSFHYKKQRLPLAWRATQGQYGEVNVLKMQEKKQS